MKCEYCFSAATFRVALKRVRVVLMSSRRDDAVVTEMLKVGLLLWPFPLICTAKHEWYHMDLTWKVWLGGADPGKVIDGNVSWKGDLELWCGKKREAVVCLRALS